MAVRKQTGTPRFWTEERLVELRRLYNLEWTVQQMADHFGVSKGAICSAAHKNRLSSPGRRAILHSKRFKGKPTPPHVRKIRSETMRRRHQEPGFTERMIAKMTAPEARRRAYDTKRGFHVPDHLLDDFHLLARKLRDAKEAGRVLGLLKEEAA